MEMERTVYRPRRDHQAVADAWGDWIAGMGEWHLFGGLTYDQRRRRLDGTGMPIPPGADVARRHVLRWLGDGSERLGRPVEAAVVALEYQRNGWPHFHPLLRLPGGLAGNELQELGGLWFERHGYAKLEPPRDRADVCAYAAKYLSKDLARGDVLFWPRRGGLGVHQPGLAAQARSASKRRR
jgi:hypothetical protein